MGIKSKATFTNLKFVGHSNMCIEIQGNGMKRGWGGVRRIKRRVTSRSQLSASSAALARSAGAPVLQQNSRDRDSCSEGDDMSNFANHKSLTTIVPV
jgi:hypothetical protein